MKSKVRWFTDERGFGFIEYKEDGDIIVHYSAIPKENGETMQLEISKFDIDYKAINELKKIKETN